MIYPHFRLEDQPWELDPEFKNFSRPQKVFINAVLNSVAAIYVGGRRSGKTTMYNFIKRWLDVIERHDTTGEVKLF